ncbi:MAG: hypothetical protein JOZ43_02935, partial [Acidobacteriales bacterium]|nr:hypothetical protein [Terriglobales bacterium]
MRQVSAAKAVFGICAFVMSVAAARAQAPSAEQIVQQVVNNELKADQSDRTFWMFKDAKKTPERASTKLVIETPHGNVSRLLEVNGKGLTDA